jgi:transcriptional regulator with XRE-family HTH domain
MVIENIEKIRQARGIAKCHLAGKLGLTPMGYTHICNGGKLTAERIEIIAEALRVKPGIFFDDELTQTVIDEIQNAGTEIA